VDHNVPVSVSLQALLGSAQTTTETQAGCATRVPPWQPDDEAWDAATGVLKRIRRSVHCIVNDYGIREGYSA
jgi:hypothetical protein